VMCTYNQAANQWPLLSEAVVHQYKEFHI